MSITGDDVTRAVLNEAGDEFDECVTKIRHCLDQLTDEQIWWRPAESMNSIGNLILHLAGNVRQWMVSGLGGEPVHRDRPAEFAHRDPIPKAMLIAPLEQAVRETKEVFARTGAAEMLAERTIQGFEVTGWKALFHCIPHFKGHTQEIICLTRLQLKDRYKFHWQPENAAQGAPASA